MKCGRHTFHKIMSQPQIWRHALTLFSEKQAELTTYLTNNTFDTYLQLIAYHRSLFNQQDPDNPHNLTQVISLDNI